MAGARFGSRRRGLPYISPFALIEQQLSLHSAAAGPDTHVGAGLLLQQHSRPIPVANFLVMKVPRGGRGSPHHHQVTYQRS